MVYHGIMELRLSTQRFSRSARRTCELGKRSIFSSHTRFVYGSLFSGKCQFIREVSLLCTLQTRPVTLVTYSLTYTDLVCKIPRLIFWFAARVKKCTLPSVQLSVFELFFFITKSENPVFYTKSEIIQKIGNMWIHAHRTRI